MLVSCHVDRVKLHVNICMEQNVIYVTVCTVHFQYQVYESPANYRELNTQFSATFSFFVDFSINKEFKNSSF